MLISEIFPNRYRAEGQAFGRSKFFRVGRRKESSSSSVAACHSEVNHAICVSSPIIFLSRIFLSKLRLRPSVKVVRVSFPYPYYNYATPRFFCQGLEPANAYFEVWCLKFLWSLELGSWNFFESLKFEVCSFPHPCPSVVRSRFNFVATASISVLFRPSGFGLRISNFRYSLVSPSPEIIPHPNSPVPLQLSLWRHVQHRCAFDIELERSVMAQIGSAKRKSNPRTVILP